MYSGQRTQLYTNGSIDFYPLWTKGVSEHSAESHTYSTAALDLFETLECSGLRQFVLSPDLREDTKFLYGGRDDVAEGASYRICTRLMVVNGSTKLVAIKVVKGSLYSSQLSSHGAAAASRLQTIRRDILIMTRPQYRKQGGHPHVLSCLGYGWNATKEAAVSAFLVVPWAQHGNLRDFIRGLHVSYATKKELFKQVCLGLRSLHMHDIAHGDVKMENVLVFNRPHLETEEGIRDYEVARKKYPQVPPISENVHLRLCDFGCSVSTNSDSYIGTTVYNAPEVRSGAVNHTLAHGKMSRFTKCDIFSCGLLLVEMLLDRRSIASEDKVQTMDLGEKSELPALDFALDLVLQISADSRWSERGRVVFGDLFTSIFSATLKFRPDQRHSVDHLLDLIERATWRLTFASDDDETLKLIIGNAGTLNLYDPMHQLNQIDPLPQPGDEDLPRVDFENLPLSMISQLVSSWYETSVNGKGEAADLAADRVVLLCLERRWTKVTDTDGFLSILETYVRQCRGHHAPLLYYRLLHSLGRARPNIVVNNPQSQEIIDLECSLVDGCVSNAEYEYERVRSYRNLIRSTTKTTLPDELVEQQVRLAIPKENSAHLLWNVTSIRHVFHSPEVLIWLVQAGEVSILREVLHADETALNSNNASLVHRLLMEACRMGYLEVLECLSDANRVNFSKFKLPSNKNPLHFLATFDRADVDQAISLLMKAGYSLNDDVDKDDGIRYTFLPHYMFWGSPLSVAVMHNRTDIVRALLDQGSEVRSMGRHHSSPLNIAARCNRPEMVRLLCERLPDKKNITMSPLRTLALGNPYGQELVSGTEKVKMLGETVELLIKYGFDINEQAEAIPAAGYHAEINIFERALRDCDFTVDFCVLDVLLDCGFKCEVPAPSLPEHLERHHEGIQVRLIAYLIERGLVSAQSDLRGLCYTLVYRGMAGTLDVVLRGLPECKSFLGGETFLDGHVSPLQFAVSMRAEADMMTVLLDHGASVNGTVEFTGSSGLRHSMTYFEVVVSSGQPDVIDLFIDRGVEITPNMLMSFAADRHLRVNENHILHHLLRIEDENSDSERVRHLHVVMLLGQTVTDDEDGEIVYEALLNIAVTRFNLDAILSLLSIRVPIQDWLYQKLIIILVTHAIVAGCLAKDAQDKYIKEKGFESLRQFLIAIWKLLVHWALQQEESSSSSEDSLGFSYLHWAAIMSDPEITHELIAGGADVFAQGCGGHVALDVVSLVSFRNDDDGGDDDGLDAFTRVYKLLFGEHLNQLQVAPPRDANGVVQLDQQTMKEFVRKSHSGALEFLLRRLLTCEALNDRMLCERARTLQPKEDQDDFWLYLANFWLLQDAREELVYSKAWLETVSWKDGIM
ncbi:hypothetical protein PV08_02361 [Exophiala spinifera]|uniref:Protein kinase domain-containing protein n=1 Tax=Exophiala spinifera TaxID=91928 RepID=A0A0D2C399_9EURO|nr:uncharacterized protein PV08_02361 [Exophiala spinifera]KIW18074.1 hypothetical protein PV08_02361 [Exophiala spinifera]